MYLITHSLLSSWSYTFSCIEDYQEQADQDFLSALRREHKDPTPEMQNGIDFENLVYAIAKGAETYGYMPATDPSVWEPQDGLVPFEVKDHKWYQGANAVATAIKGAQFQVKASRQLSVAGTDFLVYGILDALRAGSIFDVKFLNKSFGSADLVGKYLNSTQHPTYFYLVPEAFEFTYLVSDGQDLYAERYTPEDTEPISNIIEHFIKSIDSMGLLDVYRDNWLAR